MRAQAVGAQVEPHEEFFAFGLSDEFAQEAGTD